LKQNYFSDYSVEYIIYLNEENWLKNFKIRILADISFKHRRYINCRCLGRVFTVRMQFVVMLLYAPLITLRWRNCDDMLNRFATIADRDRHGQTDGQTLVSRLCILQFYISPLCGIPVRRTMRQLWVCIVLAAISMQR